MKQLRNTFIANRLREVFLHGKWIANTNFKEQITNISFEIATAKYANLNSIYLLTYHIHYYLQGVQHYFDTGLLNISDKYSFDAPIISSEVEWNKMVNSFIMSAEKLANTVERMEDTKFDLVFSQEQYGSNYRNLEAIIEHSYYHLGQMVLIKKLVLANNT